MRTVVTSKAMGTMAIALLLTCPFVHTSAEARLVQRTVSTSAKPNLGGEENPVGRPAKATVLAKNTNPTTLSRPEPTAPKPQKVEGKNTISRCWKRLMGNMREVRHAHRKK